jgi:hypothetical protein
MTDIAQELQQDLAAGGTAATNAAISNAALSPRDFEQTTDARLASLEQAIKRHERAIKHTLQIAAQLIEGGI